MRRKGHQTILSGYRTLRTILNIYNYNNTNNKALASGINPLKIDMKYIRHTYDLHIVV